MILFCVALGRVRDRKGSGARDSGVGARSCGGRGDVSARGFFGPMDFWYTRRMVHYNVVGANALAFSRMRRADSSMVSRTLQMAKRTSARGGGIGLRSEGR